MKGKVSPDFSTILASSVHDMKNSIGMLIASVETILEEYTPQNEQQKKHFKTLQYEASRINGELIQLLTLYRNDNGFLPVNIDEQFVADILEDQIARNQLLLDAGNIEFELHCDESLIWYFDADLVGGVIHNVLVNCIRYTDSKVLISATEINGKLCISISDNGPGYPDDMLRDPSNRVEQAQLAEGATHLGLYFAGLIAELHKQDGVHGFIELINDGALGGGEFRLFLP